MVSSGFVAPVAVISTTGVTLSKSSFTSRQQVAVPVARRAQGIVMMDKDRRIPQGFTAYAENLNGRAAMIGFLLAVVTEAITGEGIVGQLYSVVKNAETLSPFNWLRRTYWNSIVHQ